MDFTLEPAEHIICDGILSDVPIGRLERGGTGEVEIAICFLSYGRFKIGAEVKSVKGSLHDTRAGVGQLVAVVHDID
jgi:hypothetical protein